MTLNSIIYFDHNSTTRLLDEAKEFMAEIINLPLNASSIHSLGRKAKFYKEQAKDQILDVLGLARDNYRVIFTATGTEANNLVIKNFYDTNIIISPLEHLSVYKHKDYTNNLSIVDVTNKGLIDIEHLESLLIEKKGKILVSAMMANNETGIIQPMGEISNLCKKYGAYLHTDACQSIGKMNTDFASFNLDFITISGHKFGASQGIAALIMKKEHHLIAQNIGGGQEYGIRSGSENIAAIVSMGAAARAIKTKYNYQDLGTLRDKLENELLTATRAVKIIGYNQKRLSNTSAITMPNISAMTQMVHFDTKGFAISLGSACSSGSAKPSHVLLGMGIDPKEADNTIRVSLGVGNNEEQIISFVKVWKELYNSYIV